MATHAANIWDTKLGEALKPLLPKETIRVIIDIQYDDAIKVYYETYATQGLLNIDWLGAFKEMGVSTEQVSAGCARANQSEGIKDDKI